MVLVDWPIVAPAARPYGELPDLGVRKSSLLAGRTVCPVTDVQRAKVARTITQKYAETERVMLRLCEVCRSFVE